MKVLMCCSELEKSKGGMVSVVRNYLEYKNWEDIDIIYVPTHTEGSRAEKALFFAKSYLKILWILLSAKPDAAHLHMSERGSFYRKAWILKLCRIFGIPVLLHHHGAEFEDFYGKLSKRQKAYVVKILELAQQNLVLSRFLVPLLKQKAPNANVQVLYNAVFVPDLNCYSEKNRNLLFLGRLGQRKGTYDLLRAIQLIDCELDEDIRLNLCGDGEIQEVKDYIEKLGIGHRIGFIGWVSGNQKEKILESAMMNILPSYNEGFPMTILETMAKGIPNISTRVAAIPEMICSGTNGYLIEAGDWEILAERILQLSRDTALRKRLSEAAYQTVSERYSIEENIRQLKKVYRELI